MKKDMFNPAGFLKILQKYRYLAVIIFVGLFLLVLPQGEKEKETAKESFVEFELDRFEKRIEACLSECNGVGRCKVILSINSGPESVFEKDSKKSARENESGVMIESDSDIKPSIVSEGSGRQSPLIVKELYPEFRGAVIICDGADRTDVQSSVISSVSALTGLGSNKISIIKMKK